MNRVASIVDRLCSVVPDRRPGGVGNGEAVDYVAQLFRDAGWDVTLPEFNCLDWVGGGGVVEVRGRKTIVTPSPYGLGVDGAGPVRVVRTAADLTRSGLGGAVVVVSGDLVSEPMTPKSFPFYGSDEHASIISALETARPLAIIAVTGKYPALCGALDPFPWIEDGDFSVPVAALRPSDAEFLLAASGESASVLIEATRVPSTARNVVARRGPDSPRLTVCAHIDTKPGTPGAVDNATGVATLVLLAEQLQQNDTLPIGVELLAVNGEDHYAAPGEKAWLEANDGDLDAIELFINIDGAGYRQGRTAFSLYNTTETVAASIRSRFAGHDDLFEGPLWYQSDHAIFAMQGRPALAFTTELVNEMLDELFHAPTDTIAQIAPERVSNLATALEVLITNWQGTPPK